MEALTAALKNLTELLKPPRAVTIVMAGQSLACEDGLEDLLVRCKIEHTPVSALREEYVKAQTVRKVNRVNPNSDSKPKPKPNPNTNPNPN